MNDSNKSGLFRNFPGYDRLCFPEKVKRVTAGAGGEALLIAGSDKTALIDTGMAYCADELIDSIKKFLETENRQLDLIFLTHTHYDHIGALPYVLKEWPNAVVYGAEYCKKVFSSSGAKDKMKELGEIAWKKYKNCVPEEVLVEGLRVDQTVRDFDRISLGKEYVVALETKGHTDCSVTYVLEPDGIMFASESTGVLESPDFMHVSILKSYKDSMDSVGKCRDYPVRHLISPHFGMVPDHFVKEYWEMFLTFAEAKKNFIYQLYLQKLSLDEIMKEYLIKFWTDSRSSEQPKEAFKENAKYIIKAILKEF